MAKRVLIVDDEAATAWALSESLREDGLEPTIAHSAGEARQLLREEFFDLLISDVRLPDQSGLELLREREGSRPPAILVTAFDGEEVAAAVRDLEAVACYRKPFDLDSLRETVSRVLGAVPELPPTD